MKRKPEYISTSHQRYNRWVPRRVKKEWPPLDEERKQWVEDLISRGVVEWAARRVGLEVSDEVLSCGYLLLCEAMQQWSSDRGATQKTYATRLLCYRLAELVREETSGHVFHPDTADRIPSGPASHCDYVDCPDALILIAGGTLDPDRKQAVKDRYYPRVKRETKIRGGYPWDLWFNGKRWTLRRGIDFECSPRSFYSTAIYQAQKRGILVSVCSCKNLVTLEML